MLLGLFENTKSRSVLTWTVILFSVVTGLSVAPNSAGAMARPALTSAGSGPDTTRWSFAEHRYRIVGKLRLALFWIGLDEIGTARMTWRSDGHHTTLALLAGSDPQYAPRHVNLWGYVRENVSSEQATIVAMRNPATANLLFRGSATVDRSMFSAACTSITPNDMTTALTNVRAGGLTYRALDRALEQAVNSPHWERRSGRRPNDSDVGFLSAMVRLLTAQQVFPGGSTGPRSAQYLYNGAPYRLTMLRREPAGHMTLGSSAVDDLIRAEFVVTDPASKDQSTFSVTYAPDAEHVVLPVQIMYQPNFWLRIELRLDDLVAPPPDPEDDEGFAARIQALCEQTPR